MWASLGMQMAWAGELRRIGVSVTDLGNPFFVRIAHGVEVAAHRQINAKVQVFVSSSAYDLGRQAMQIDAFIQKKVDLIVITAADPLAIEPAVRRAQAAGIPVIAVDVRAAGANATITTDNIEAGRLACDYIGKRLKGQGKLVIINGPRVSATVDRVEGCLRSLKAYPGIQLLSSDRDGGGSAEGGFAKMTDLLTLYPHIDAVFAINDPTAMGAEEAARQAKRAEFFIVGVDGAPKTRQRMQEADTLIAATVAQLPDLQAEKAVEYGYRLIRKLPLPHTIALITPTLVTKDSPAQPGAWQE